MASKKRAAKNECTSVVGHFDGHGGAYKQYRRHCSMRQVQGYPGSHRTLPSGNYLLLIAPAAARATANKMTTKKWTNCAGYFDGRSSALVQYCTHLPMEEVQGFGKSHWTPSLGKYAADRCNRSHIRRFFLAFSL
jgi:hypothetical protein